MKCEICGKRMNKQLWMQEKYECKECKKDLANLLYRAFHPNDPRNEK